MKDLEKQYYNQDEIWSDINSLEKERVDNIIKIIPQDVNTILDAGCGSGAVVNSLPKNFKRVVGLDFSEKALGYVLTEKVLAGIEDIPFEDKSFDLAICSEVLEHLDEDIYSKALIELQRISKKYIILTVPNNENLKRSSVFCPDCQKMVHPFFHVRNFNKNSVKNIFKDFNSKTIKAIGPKQPHIPSYLVDILRSFDKPSPLVTSVCPFCGYKPRNTGSRAKKYFLKSKLRSFFPKQPKWLLALYEAS